MNLTRILRDGALLSLVASAYLLLLLRVHPRLFLTHYPEEIRSIVPPRSTREKWVSLLLGILIGAPCTAALLWRSANLGTHAFGELFAYAFGVLFVFNLVDLLILDWLIVCRFKLSWAILPGTEHVVIRHPYFHHSKEFLIGTVGLAIVGLAVAAYYSHP